MQLTLTIHKGRREKPEAIAAICGNERTTHRRMADRVARLGAVLRGLGMQPGDRIGILALNSIRYLEYFFGTWWGGGAINPCNIRWSAHEVAYSLDDCDTRILLVDDRFAPMVPALRNLSKSLTTVIYYGAGPVPDGMLDYEALLAATEPMEDLGRHGDDLAAVMYTGGTTGTPKGVMLSHTNIGINALSNITAVSRQAVHVGLAVTPLFHIAGCGLVLLMALRGELQVIVPAFDELAILQAIQQHRVNEMFLVPTMIQRLIEHPRFAEFDLSSLRLMLYGAAPIDAALLERAITALPSAEFAQAYGMTELAPTVAILGVAEHHQGPNRDKWLRAAGRPAPIAEIRIVDPQGRECPLGTVGEIAVRGPMVMQGYWNKPKETAAALKDGWMHTGDSGRFDEDGYLYVVDRIKDMIVSGGENVYSVEVENALASHPAVATSAVIGVPDERWGERVHAIIVLRPDEVADEAALIAHCKQLIADYKCPRSIEFRTELPLSAAGKLQKFQLREPYWAGRSRRIN